MLKFNCPQPCGKDWPAAQRKSALESTNQLGFLVRFPPSLHQSLWDMSTIQTRNSYVLIVLSDRGAMGYVNGETIVDISAKEPKAEKH